MARTKKSPEPVAVAGEKCPTCHRTLPTKTPPKTVTCVECKKPFEVQGRGAVNRKTCSAECFLTRTRRQQRRAQDKFRSTASPA